MKQFPTQQTNNQISDNKTASRVTSALDKNRNKPEKQLKNVKQEIDCLKDVEIKSFPASSVSYEKIHLKNVFVPPLTSFLILEYIVKKMFNILLKMLNLYL